MDYPDVRYLRNSVGFDHIGLVVKFIQSQLLLLITKVAFYNWRQSSVGYC